MAGQPEKREEVIFYQALEKDPADREAHLKESCGDDQTLYRRVKALLQAYDSDDTAHHVRSSDSQTTTLHPSNSEGPSSVIGRYKLLEKIGEGGFGVVWAAEQKKPVKRRVALKIIKLGMDTKQVVARFEAERQALALMDHPNIAKVLDAGATDTGRPYFVMELVRGIPIIEYCDQETCSTRERLDLFVKICHAIQHAHQKGIIHRDIKPSNILITLHDGDPVPRVIDFGIAKATQQELTEMTLYTQHQQFIGTPAYMSPEQAEMSGLDIDTRSDIYSLGVLLYEILTGRTPFDAKELMQSGIDQMRKIIREQEPPKPSTKFATLQNQEQSTTATRHATDSPRLISLLRGDLDWIVMKCIEKKRTRRYHTANGLAEDVLRHLSNEPVVARPPTVLYQLQKAWLRNKVVYTAACTVVASLIIGISVSLWQAWEATKARDAAEKARRSEFALREEAQESERTQRVKDYAADMSQAQRYLTENNLSMLDVLLNRYVPREGEEGKDVRGINWHRFNTAISEGTHVHTLPHSAMVRSISLSNDGMRLASITMSGKVRLFDVNDVNGVISHSLLQEHGGGFMFHGAQDGSVALSPDGRLLAADQQGTLIVWDASSAEEVFRREQVTAPISFSPNSKSLIGVTEAGLQVWNTADWTSRKILCESLDIGPSRFRALSFTPDSSRVILAPTRFKSALIVYNLDQNVIEGTLPGLDYPGVISTTNAIVAAGGRDGHVCLWDLGSRKTIKENFKANRSIVLGVALSPDGKTLVTGGNQAAISVWDVNSPGVERRRFLKGHHSQVWNLKFSHDGRYLVSASMDHSVKLWTRESVDAPGQTGFEAKNQETKAQPPKPTVRSKANSGSTTRRPKIHAVMSGDSIQAAIDRAVAGDTIDIGVGIHEITEMIVLDKPLTIRGAAGNTDRRLWPTILKGATDLPFVIRVETGAARVSVIQDLQIEANLSGIQHMSGACTLRHCRVIARSTSDFKAVLSLDAKGSANIPVDTVTIDDCTLLAEDAGPTIEGSPPDIDVILFNSGTCYTDITIIDSEIRNDVPNRISNGIETRSTTAQLSICRNHIRAQGMGIVVVNHVGAVDIRNNTIWSTDKGISVGTETRLPSFVIGNHITIDAQERQVYPMFLQDYIAETSKSCIAIGGVSAGVTEGFFLKKAIPRATNLMVKENILMGNPKYGVALKDSPEPESYGPPTRNYSHDNIITQNNFTDLQADQDIALGASTHDNKIFDNKGIKSIFRAAGDNDRNSIKHD